MQKEIKVRKANKVLRVSENEIAKYTAMGYDIIDDMGNVVQASVPHDPNVLKKAFSEHEATIAKLTDEISQLKAQIAELSVSKPKAVDVEQPRRRNKKSQS